MHKLKIAGKEAFETWYWLYLCQHTAGYPYDESLKLRLDDIMHILHSILHQPKS